MDASGDTAKELWESGSVGDVHDVAGVIQQ
jgi:hypothetical protein